MNHTDGEAAFEPGFYWVSHNNKTVVAEWCDMGNGWKWSFTRAEAARRVDKVICKIAHP